MRPRRKLPDTRPTSSRFPGLSGARVSSLRTTRVATGGSCSRATSATTITSTAVRTIPMRRSQRRPRTRGRLPGIDLGLGHTLGRLGVGPRNSAIRQAGGGEAVTTMSHVTAERPTSGLLCRRGTGPRAAGDRRAAPASRLPSAGGRPARARGGGFSHSHERVCTRRTCTSASPPACSCESARSTPRGFPSWNDMPAACHGASSWATGQRSSSG